jgi:hypothetical protein
MLPVSELARAKMRITLGQLPDLPFSSSLRVLVPNWRAERVMGEATARLASMARVRNFMVVDVEYDGPFDLRSNGYDDIGKMSSTEAVVLSWGWFNRERSTSCVLILLAPLDAQTTLRPTPALGGICRQRKESFNVRALSVDGLGRRLSS